MAVESYSAAALARRATTLAVALMTLSSGVYFGIKAPDNSNSIVQQVMTQDGRSKLILTGSGGLTSSGALKVRANMSGSSLNVDGTVRLGSGVIITRTLDIGWSVQASANQACNTTCTNACVFGEDTSVLGSFVSCSDATADRCLCAGSN